MQQVFAPGNVDSTWGVIGLLIMLLGAIAAFGRRRTRRSRVRRELVAIERAYENTKDRPRACEAALAERRARVEGLGLDGKLDQSGLLVLHHRIDLLSRDLRVGQMNREFRSLPHGLVLSVNGMLADGILTAEEHDQLLKALQRDASVTAPQKRRLRALVNEWARRDLVPRR
jgi:hypothetical protein